MAVEDRLVSAIAGLAPNHTRINVFDFHDAGIQIFSVTNSPRISGHLFVTLLKYGVH